MAGLVPRKPLPPEQREMARLRAARWRAANPDRVKANRERWSARPEYREKARVRTKEWNDARPGFRQARYTANAEREREGARAWYYDNLERCLVNARRNNGNRRARLKAAFVEDIDPMVVFDRDEGMCGICQAPIGDGPWHLDHVVPIARGGLHSYDNVQVAHAFCNLSKGARR